jgi:hypothetical protein
MHPVLEALFPGELPTADARLSREAGEAFRTERDETPASPVGDANGFDADIGLVTPVAPNAGTLLCRCVRDAAAHLVNPLPWISGIVALVSGQSLSVWFES